MKTLPPPREKPSFADILASFLVAQGAVVSSAMNEVVGKASDLLFSKGYKIADEYEADRSAVLYVAETGYYSAGLVDFLTRIMEYKKTHAKQKVYHTHPPFEERITRLNKLIREENFDMNKPRNEQRFKRELGHIQ